MHPTSDESEPGSAGRAPKIVLVVVLVFFLAMTLVLNRLDHHDLTTPESNHLLQTYLVHKRSFDNVESPIRSSMYFNYPPMFYWVSSLIVPSNVPNRHAATFILWFWTALGLGAFFAFVHRRTCSWTALFAVTALVAAPAFRINFLYFYLDVAVFAMLFIYLALLDRSRAMALKMESTAAGAALGLGFLVRWDFPFLVALPTLAAIVRHGAEYRGRHWTRLFLFGAPAVATAVLFFKIANGIPEGGTMGEEATVDAIVSWDNLLFYPRLWVASFLGHGMALLAAAGTLVGLWRDRRNTLWYLLVIVGVLTLYTPIAHKTIKYTLLPSTALCCALMATLWRVVRGPWRLVLIGLLCASNVTTFSRAIHGEKPFGEEYGGQIAVRGVDPLDSGLARYQELLQARCPNYCHVGLVDTLPASMLERGLQLDGESAWALNWSARAISGTRFIVRPIDVEDIPLNDVNVYLVPRLLRDDVPDMRGTIDPVAIYSEAGPSLWYLMTPTTQPLR
ncbi:MAG: hypothetical protein H6685_05425 [Deltaproteobacteria bacterium]|nr:hypothetical protein [Deltaproteobacteria bacterium]